MADSGLNRTGSRSTSSRSSQEDLSEAVLVSGKAPLGRAEEQSADRVEVPSTVFECAVCLQTCIHPVKLPCTHIFCYLCVKGVAFQSRRCAMCRQEIPADFLINPQLLDRSQLEKESSLEDGYQWFYEGRNGWWQYDERTSHELECAFKRSQRLFELLIAGYLYMIDFDQMLQYRKAEPLRRRRIKRDLGTIAKKGVAGIRLEQSGEETDSGASASMDVLSVAANRAALNTNCLSPSQTPQVPSNTPQTPQTPRSPPSPEADGTQQDIQERWQDRERRRLRQAVEEIERLRLHDGDRLSSSSSTLPRLTDNIAIFYNLDEADVALENGPDVWISADTSSSDDEEHVS